MYKPTHAMHRFIFCSLYIVYIALYTVLCTPNSFVCNNLDVPCTLYKEGVRCYSYICRILFRKSFRCNNLGA